ncbi:MAG: hypothetical protein CL928_13950 [Deltaproteobacteria bacterium]|nr:hypothetical protein [Deltaproteobacteria bacterium]
MTTVASHRSNLIQIVTTGLAALLLGGCPNPNGAGYDDVPTLAILGGGDHTTDSLSITTMVERADGLDVPTDLEFNPTADNQLWITNRGDNTVLVVLDVDSDNPEPDLRTSFGADHFLVKPSALAFSDNGNFATIHEEDDFTQGPPPMGTPADFMGPTLWSSHLGDAGQHPDGHAPYDGGHGSHLDMLHNSPNGMGIAWEEDNVFWVFDGAHSSITRYDFHDDHGPGGSDHSDGEIARYVEGEVDRDSDVPSHMVLDHDTGLLYIADTGNSRIAVLDTNEGSKGANVSPNYDMCELYEMDDGELETLVDGEDVNLRKPSGIALHDDVLYVSDNRSSVIFGFSLEGELIDWVDLERPREDGADYGGLMGLEFDDDGNLWAVDAQEEEVIKISVVDTSDDDE